jgi:N-acetyl sugar amidotransferase
MKVCKTCIYDETIPAISFDDAGVCNYCRQFDEMQAEYPTGAEGRKRLEEIVAEMKKAGAGKPYDVVIGVSGGCDSSYMLHVAKKEFGLRPLAVHFDNTWNSKIAVENIQTMLEKLDIDLYTHVVDNREICDLMKSFLLASVPEIDTPTDLALAATHYMAAEKYGIKYIWEGHSFRTEGISPVGWFYMDAKYIETVQKQFGNLPIKTLPMLHLRKWFKWMLVGGIKKIRPLYFIDFNKTEVKKFLQSEYGWQWYGGHHMENRTACFVNNYYLPKKFGIDLRRCEFSALVRSGQMSRDEALEEIGLPKPFDEEILDEYKKRLDLTDEQFEAMMRETPKSFRDYKTYKETFIRLRPFFWLLYNANFVPKSFYEKFTKRN